MQHGWYYRVSGRECGPVSFERLAELVRHRRLLPADEILKGPTGSWTKIRDCREFPPLLEGQPATSTVESSERPADRSATGLNASDPDFVESCSRSPQIERAWYCLIRQEELGPFRASELQRMLFEGKLIPLDLVRRGTSGNWKEYFQWERRISADAAVESVAPNESSVAQESASAVVESESPDLQAEQPTTSNETWDREPEAAESVATASLPVARLSGAPRRATHTGRARPARAERLRELVREHWPLAAAGAVLLSANLFALSPTTDPNRECHRSFNELLNRVQSLRDQHASAEEWEQVERDVEHNVQPMIVALKKNSDVRHPVEQHLLWAGRDYLLPLIEDYKRESLDPQKNPRSAASEAAVREQRFQKHMHEAARLFENER